MEAFYNFVNRPKVWLFAILMLHCNGLVLAEEWRSPEPLVSFWSGIQPSWMPATENEYWKDSDRKRVIDYCEKFAKMSSAPDLLPGIVADLKAHPSVIRTFVYMWLVMNWNEATVMPLLNRYYTSSDPAERSIAGDFIAAIEENTKGKKP